MVDIVKPMEPTVPPIVEDGNENEVVPMDVEVVVDDDLEVDLEGEDEDDVDLSQVPFGENLADYIEEEELAECASELIDAFESDVKSREDWERAYIDGLDLLGISTEDRDSPWAGSFGGFHPLLTEAVVRFQSQAILEIFPAAGPVRSQVLGKQTPEKIKQAGRVEEEMNYILTEKMTEYRPETEQLLFRLPLAGSTFRKVYYDPIEERPAAIMVPVEDFVVPYGASDLKVAERYTHIMRKSPNELRKLQKTGMYVDIEIDEPSPEYSEVQKAHDDINGQQPTLTQDHRHTLLEVHVDWDFGEGDWALPYVITIEKSSAKVIGVRRNWSEEDQHKRKIIHFAHYQYMPGLGFYGIGLVHLIGGLAKGATALLRQLVDSGTLANLLAGFKTRGMRVLGDDSPLQPGEFRDVEAASGTIGENMYVLPFKEPSATLYQLLQTLVDEGRRIASIADVEVGDMSGQAPVGTTLALLERSMKVMSAVHARLHASLRTELRLIAKIIGDFMPPNYEYDEEQEFDRSQDFGAKVDILPVSDPNAATLSQRVVQYQSVFQMYQASPDLFDGPVFFRKMMEAMQIRDGEDLVPLPDEIQPMDPVTENMAIITGRPVKAFIHQDHESHIQAHTAAIMDPKIMEMVGQSPKAGAVMAAAEAHIAEHLAYRYRQQIEEELGAQLPPPEEPLPPEVEVRLSRLVADAANRVFYRNKDEEQRKKNEQLMQDPLIQIQLREQKLKEDQFDHKKAMDILQLGEKTKDRVSQERRDALGNATKLAVAEDDRLAAEASQVAGIASDFVKNQDNNEVKREMAKSKTEAKPKPVK